MFLTETRVSLSDSPSLNCRTAAFCFVTKQPDVFSLSFILFLYFVSFLNNLFTNNVLRLLPFSVEWQGSSATNRDGAMW